LSSERDFFTQRKQRYRVFSFTQKVFSFTQNFFYAEAWRIFEFRERIFSHRGNRDTEFATYGRLPLLLKKNSINSIILLNSKNNSSLNSKKQFLSKL